MPVDHWILVGAWALFGLIHSLMAGERFVAFFRSAMGRHFIYYRLVYSVVAVLSLTGVLLWQFSLPGIALVSTSGLNWLIGIPPACLGVFVMGKCIQLYFLRHSGVAAFLGRQQEPSFLSGGIHRHVRHPLYFGTLLLIWSLFLIFPSLKNLIACGMITLYTIIGIRLEEKKLLRQFGSSYAVYRRATPMLIPGKLPLKFFQTIKAVLTR
jgi:protein-S-isoprenylcysteine O-methyltransferase Ste14